MDPIHELLKDHPGAVLWVLGAVLAVIGPALIAVGRLIGKQNARLDDHEARITSLEGDIVGQATCAARHEGLEGSIKLLTRGQGELRTEITSLRTLLENWLSHR